MLEDAYFLQQRWGYRPLLLETFVDLTRFYGGCYRAAGWELLGRTTGEGLVRAGRRYQTRPKLIFAKPNRYSQTIAVCYVPINFVGEPNCKKNQPPAWTRGNESAAER